MKMYITPVFLACILVLACGGKEESQVFNEPDAAGADVARREPRVVTVLECPAGAPDGGVDNCCSRGPDCAPATVAGATRCVRIGNDCARLTCAGGLTCKTISTFSVPGSCFRTIDDFPLVACVEE